MKNKESIVLHLHPNGVVGKIKNRRVYVLDPKDEGEKGKFIFVCFKRLIESKEHLQAIKESNRGSRLCEKDKAVVNEFHLTRAGAESLYVALGKYLEHLTDDERADQRKIEAMMAEHES